MQSFRKHPPVELTLRLFILLAACLTILTTVVSAAPPTVDPTYGMPLPTSSTSNSSEGSLPANWIWSANVSDQQTVLFRRSFTLTKTPSSAVIWITADNFFVLYVNGTLVGKSVPDPNDGNVWQHVHTFDISSYLNPGDNIIAVGAFNVGGPAGLLAGLRMSGTDPIVTDGRWKVSPVVDNTTSWLNAAFDDSSWAPATVEGDTNDPTWSGGLSGWPGFSNVPYLSHIMLSAAAVLQVSPGSGDIDDAESIIGNSDAQVAVATPPSPTQSPSFVVDFGREVSGSVALTGTTGGTVIVSTGESLDETLKGPFTGRQTLQLLAGIPVHSKESAFRYALFVFPGSDTIQTISMKVGIDHRYYPVIYRGSFDCSDPLLTQIWYTGAYTAHLCMQIDIWDAPKRDRARWSGDLNVSGEVIDDVFADKFLMEQTLDRLRADAQSGKPDTEEPGSHVNGIPGYSAAWICTLASFHRHLGDYAYLNKHHDDLLSLLAFIKADFNQDNLFANSHSEWVFVDWAPDYGASSNTADATTDMFFIKAVQDGVFLLREMGDTANADIYEAWLQDLLIAARSRYSDPVSETYGKRLQENAMAVYSGTATPEQEDAIYGNILGPDTDAWNRTTSPAYNDKVFTPYYGNYILYAISMAGNNTDAEDLMRRYWGGMIAEGATTFWEAYDPLWPKDDFHANLYADASQGYGTSLCHGWSSGPTAFLTERVLGVVPTGGGFKTVSIIPDLGDLTWAEGDVPTPNGNIHIRTSSTGDTLVSTVTIPDGVVATFGATGSAVTLNGKSVCTVSGEDGARTLTLDHAGTFTIKSTL